MNPREAATLEYVEDHKLQQLMQQLLELVTFHQPRDPRQFITGTYLILFLCIFFVEQLQNLVSARDTGTEPPTLLEANNFAAIFGLIDITGRGRYRCFSEINKNHLLAFQKQKLNPHFAKSESRVIFFSPSLSPETIS